MKEIPKAMKKALGRLANEAYEIELGRALAGLREEFDRWERGEIAAFDLEAAIHRFHQGPARDLFKRYHDNGIQKVVVAGAIADGILDRTKVALEVLEFLAGALSFWEQEQASSDRR
jgi:hypothetical protein